MGYPGKYNTGVVTRRTHPIGYDLDNNGPIYEGIWRVQRYRFGGGYLEGMYLDHEHLTPLCHHTE